MFMSEVNYTSMESSPQEISNSSDVENVAMSPDDARIDVVNVEQASFDDRSSVKSGRNGDCARTWTMAKVQVGYDITRKGERSLVVDGFKFTKSRDGTNNRIFWRCSRRECKATAVTVCDRVEHVRAIHAHEPPLAAEFFGSQEGVSQRCQLQEVRFNTSAANMRPRYRRSGLSGSEPVPDEATTVKDISNANEIICDRTSSINFNNPLSKPIISLVSAQPLFQIHSADQKPPPHCLAPSAPPLRTPSVKEQSDNVSVAQFLISPVSKPQFIHTNVTALSNCSSSSTSTSSSACAAAASTIFNFSTMQINASPNAGSDSTSDAPSHKSTPGIMNSMSGAPHDEGQQGRGKPASEASYSELNLEQIIQLLLHKNGSSRQRSCSDSEWLAANSTSTTASYEQDAQPMSPSIAQGVPGVIAHSTAPTRFIHWKKEKLRESETCDEQLKRERKRRHDYVTGNSSRVISPGYYVTGVAVEESPVVSIVPESVSVPESSELCSFLNAFRPTITHKLMGVMQKLSSELCPEEAVAQEVYEKCTAIKTCLETLEKLHSLMTC